MTVAIEVSNRIIDRINGSTYSQVVQAVRYYQPKFELEDIRELKVCVVPRDVERLNISRGTDEQRTTIQIGVLKRCDPTNEGIDPLIQLTDEIASSLENWEFMNPHSAILDVKIAPLFDPELLDKNRQFTSIIELVVRTFL